MINATDRKIILTLQKNGRMSIASLARLVGVSTATAVKRVEQLLEDNYITIRGVPNPARMGYAVNAFVTLDVDLVKIQEIWSFLKNDLHVNFCCTAFGRFDILLFVFFPTWDGLNGFVKDRLSHIDGVRHVEAFIFQDILKRYERIFTESEIASEAISIDELDYALINELVIDGRVSYRSLSEKTGASIPTVARRVTNLIDKGAIKIIALPNPSKMGYTSQAIIGLKTDGKLVNSICSCLASRPEVTLIMTLINGFDILIGVHSANPETLYDFIINYVARINGVIDIETFIRAEILKRYYGWLLEA